MVEGFSNLKTLIWSMTSLVIGRHLIIYHQVLSLPNIVLILTDDEDVVLSEDYMPIRDEIFKTNGVKTTITTTCFCTTPD